MRREAFPFLPASFGGNFVFTGKRKGRFSLFFGSRPASLRDFHFQIPEERGSCELNSKSLTTRDLPCFEGTFTHRVNNTGIINSMPSRPSCLDLK